MCASPNEVQLLPEGAGEKNREAEEQGIRTATVKFSTCPHWRVVKFYAHGEAKGRRTAGEKLGTMKNDHHEDLFSNMRAEMTV